MLDGVSGCGGLGMIRPSRSSLDTSTNQVERVYCPVISD